MTPQHAKMVAKRTKTCQNGFATGGDGFSRGGDGCTRGGDGFTTARRNVPTGGDGFLRTKHAFSPSAPVAPALPARGLGGDGFPTGGDGFSRRPTEPDARKITGTHPRSSALWFSHRSLSSQSSVFSCPGANAEGPLLQLVVIHCN